MFIKQRAHKRLDEMESMLNSTHIGKIPFEISYDYTPSKKSSRFNGIGVPGRIIFVVNNSKEDV